MTREDEVILTKKEYGELVSSEFENGYAKGYREALEQEDSIIDKIKAEIEQNAYPIVHGVNNHEKGMTLNGILQIIDKYKAGE
jgi:vacuolar-type H+-ATPase subunit E/Vma4